MLICVYVILPLPQPLAQTSVPTASPTASQTSGTGEVNKGGFSLKPKGLAMNEWPNLRVDFSIERADQTIFRNLALADVEPKLDGKPVAIIEGDLQQRESQGSGVLVLLDGSGSMAAQGVDKLSAAKQGLKTLIDNLDANDRVGLITFDEEPRVITEPTADKELVKREIDNFTIRKEQSRYTRLYDAVDFGLKQANASQIKNLLLISDGWEDTPETRNSSPADLEAFKRRREQGITQFSRDNDIRVFTIAIGDEHGQGLDYVDRPALDNIAKGANGGVAAYIEVAGASTDKTLEQNFLLSRLQQTLNDLRQSFRYSYSLTLRVDEETQRKSQEHTLWVGFIVGDQPRIQLPVEYTYALSAAGVGEVIKVEVKAPIFIQSAPRSVTWQQLFFVYLMLLLGLVMLAFVPAVVKSLLRGGQSLRLHKAIVRVGSESPLIGKTCPNEGTASGRLYLIKEGDIVLVCPNRSCRTPHHLSCWAFNEHQCMQRNCELTMIVPDQVLEKYGLIERSVGEEKSWMTS